MSVPPVLRPKNERSAGSDRGGPLPLMALQSRWPRLLPWGAAVLALVIGFGAGILVMRHRHEGQQVIAAVNGTQITKDQLFSRLQAAAGQPVMHKLVEEELQLQYAAKRGLPATDAQVEARYNENRKNPQFLASLVASGLSLDDYKHGLRVKLALANVLTDKVTVSDAEVQSFYKAQSDPNNPQAQFYKPATMTFRVIAAASQKDAQSALTELNSTPFEIVASEYSKDSSKDAGGLLAPIQYKRSPLSQNPSLEKTLFAMEVGKLYGPVLFDKHWWIFRCEDKSLGQAMPFQDVQDEARLGAAILKGTKLNARAIEQDFQKFESTSSLQAFWPQYQRAVTGR